MRGEIIKIKRNWKSQNGNRFIVAIIRCDDGIARHTFICPDYLNYQRWKPLLKIGKKLSGLVLKEKDTIDADSRVVEFFKPIGEMSTEELFSKGILQ